MYKLKYGGVVKLTPSKVKKDFLLSQGFELVGEKEKEPGEKANGQVEEVDYNKLLKADLIEILDAKGIEYNGNMNKDELISLL